MKKILITCPPMIENISLLKDDFKKANFSYVIPEDYPNVEYATLLKMLPEHEAWIAGDDLGNRELLETAQKGKLREVVKWGVGIDNIDTEACKDLGLKFSHTPNMFGGEVADLAICYLIALNRSVLEVHNGVLSGNWPKITGRSMQGRNVGVLGCGDIGSALIQRLKSFEVNIVAWDPMVTIADKQVSHKPWPNSLKSCDDLILTCSLQKENFHIINTDTIKLMKEGVNIINVSRGGLINTEDLIKHMKSNHISSVALDVYEEEPLPLNSPLREFKNSIFGSHNASNTLEGVLRASRKAISQIQLSGHG